MPHTKVKLAVRNLVEFVLQGGSIDNRYGGEERAQEGARIHRRLQKLGGENYHAEVFLSHAQEYGGIEFVVEGRADGILEEETGKLVDEIKTTAAPLEIITEDFNRTHWAQAMCYGYFLCLDESLDEIRVRLTYYQVESGEVKRFLRLYSKAELAEFFESLLEKYLRWAQFEADWRDTRNQSVEGLSFPFPAYRRGQRELAVAVYRCIEQEVRLYCQAPTGIGKTISTLFPAVKALGEEKLERIFYLTAKTTTRQAAQDAANQLADGGARLKTLTITAKDKICFLDLRMCNPDDCPYAEGHYDRVGDAVYEILQENDAITRDVVERYAQKHRVCPYEFSLDIALFCDLILCDYNYLFEPNVYLRRFFSGGKGDYAFLIDEAHNLVDRAREMYSANLQKADFLDLKRQLKEGHKKLARAAGKVNDEMLKIRHAFLEDSREAVSKEKLEGLSNVLLEFQSAAELWLKDHRQHALQPQVLDAYFTGMHYLRISEFYDERYTTLLYRRGSQVTVRQYCLDPSFLVSQALSRGKAAVLFSATLSPIDYFASVLGADDTSLTYQIPSPFPPANFGLYVQPQIQTRYSVREAGYEPVADLIYQTAMRKAGNYMAFFPSYAYLNAVSEIFHLKYPLVETLMQGREMSEEERLDFLNKFEADGSPVLGFCVLGGAFSEGIDLKGSRLCGAIIVGVGLPQISPELDLIRQYYDEDGKDGFAYAYQYPGMNKVMQAAGRVIRTQDDRGVVILADERFCEPRYRSLFPPHWGHAKRLYGAALWQQLTRFWSESASAEGV